MTKPRALMPHQKTALCLIKQAEGRFCLFMAPGTGKTLTAIRYAQRFSRILVICRRDDFLTWELELLAEGENRIDMWFQDIDPFPDPWTPRWYFITYDMLRNKEWLNWVKSFPFSLVIVDESHNIKRWESARTRACIRSTRHIQRRIIMTGSPMTNHALRDLWSQVYFVDDGVRLGSKLWFFLKRYFIPEGHGWFPKRSAKDEIKRKLASIAYHVHEDDVLNLPRARRIVKGAPMSKPQIQATESILENWEYQLSNSDEPTEINHVIVQVEKLRQVAGGFIKDTETGTIHEFPCPKFDLLKQLVNEELEKGNRKLVIWCSRTAEIERIFNWASDGLAIDGYPVAHYGSNRLTKRSARLMFKQDVKCRLFIAQVDSGVGMNELVVANTAFYYSQSTKVVSRQQSMRRTRRKGSEIHKQIKYYDLVTEGSIDQKILQGIYSSMDVAQSILNQLKKGVPLRKAIQ